MSNIIFILSVTGLLMLFTIQRAESVQVNRTLLLVISSRKNQTGHEISNVSINKGGFSDSNNWKLNIEHNVVEDGGIHSFHFSALSVVPPPLPDSYQLFPGIGYYKFHPELANGFEDASLKCAQEGGHLAIVNSEAEHQVFQTMFTKYPESELKTVYAFVGFHDRLEEGVYLTIFGKPLQTTGFTRWADPAQPDNWQGIEDCGSVHRNGGLNDVICESKLPFICEYDLSWTEN